jgi:hypothetical protein
MYYLFCCCLCAACCRTGETLDNVRQQFKALGEKKEPDADVFQILVALYKHKVSSVKRMQKIRLNPDYGKKDDFIERHDLEFYVP